MSISSSSRLYLANIPLSQRDASILRCSLPSNYGSFLEIQTGDLLLEVVESTAYRFSVAEFPPCPDRRLLCVRNEMQLRPWPKATVHNCRYVGKFIEEITDLKSILKVIKPCRKDITIDDLTQISILLCNHLPSEAEQMMVSQLFTDEIEKKSNREDRETAVSTRKSLPATRSSPPWQQRKRRNSENIETRDTQDSDEEPICPKQLFKTVPRRTRNSKPQELEDIFDIPPDHEDKRMYTRRGQQKSKRREEIRTLLGEKAASRWETHRQSSQDLEPACDGNSSIASGDGPAPTMSHNFDAQTQAIEINSECESISHKESQTVPCRSSRASESDSSEYTPSAKRSKSTRKPRTISRAQRKTPSRTTTKTKTTAETSPEQQQQPQLLPRLLDSVPSAFEFETEAIGSDSPTHQASAFPTARREVISLD